jgi:hypothetical protein
MPVPHEKGGVFGEGTEALAVDEDQAWVVAIDARLRL